MVQGLGNVGPRFKFLTEEDGVLVTAIIERGGAIINDAGWTSKLCMRIE